MEKEVSQEQSVAILDKVYNLVMEGLPTVSDSIEVLMHEYQSQYANDKEAAIEKFIQNQKLKCSTTGFLTGLGGLLTLPVTLPADLASSLYMEIRMIAGIAYLRGYDVRDDSVKSLVYLCLAGNAIGDVVKKVGIEGLKQFTVKKLLPKLTREVIVKINKTVGFRLITKAGSKGLVKVSKMVPVIGGIVGGTYNWVEVAMYAKFAKQMFNENM